MKCRIIWKERLRGYRVLFEVNGFSPDDDWISENRVVLDTELLYVCQREPGSDDPEWSIPKKNLPAAIAILRFNGIEVEVEK